MIHRLVPTSIVLKFHLRRTILRLELVVPILFQLESSDNITNDEGIPQLLNWWRARETQFPKLSKMVKDVLAIQGSSVASEAAFSAIRFQIGDHIYSLAEDSLEISVLFRDWINVERRNQGLPKLDSQFELFIDSAIGYGSDDDMELQDRQ
ncbi:hypothetical protein AABB24_000815 [Solanum stoloniferum]|uniref:HAT C-terminal dimerisation domain-containing protein n=1 Tax=Solanum stoloniferum TaxID=62892 RepID=A0ABD2VJV6_9SOLN